MRQTILIKKFIISLTSWSLILSPVHSFAAEADATTEVEVEAQAATDTSTQSNQRPDTDPNYCLETSQSEVSSCQAKGLVYNCHLQYCVSSTDNQVYNKEYSDCRYKSANEVQACLDNLKATRSEIDQNAQNTASSVNSGGSTGTISAVGGVAVAGAMVAGTGCLGFSVSCPTDYGAALFGVVGIAIAFMAMQSGQIKKQFDQAKDLLKNEEESDVKGFSAMNHISTLTKQIQGMDIIIKAARDKAKKHKTVAALAGVLATAAGICIALTWSGCSATNVCSWFVVGAGVIVMMLELKASSESEEIAKKWEENKKIATKLKKKLESLYNMDSANMANLASSNISGTMASAQTINMAQTNAGIESGELPELTLEEKSCVNADNSVSNCPCKGGACKQIAFGLPKSALTSQIGEKINFAAFEKGANEAFSGNSEALDDLATDGNLAAIQGINKKIIQKILDKNKDIKKGDRELLEAIVNPKKHSDRINRFVASNLNTAQANQLAKQYGLDNLTPPDSKEGELVTLPTDFNIPKFDEAAFKKQFSDIEVGINNDQMAQNAISGENENSTDEQASDMLIGSQINPEKKLSIFKIISNRYNIVRVKKGLGN